MATRQVFRKMLSANSVNLCNFIQGPTLHFEDTKQRSTSPSIEIPAEPHNYWALGPDMSTNDIIKAQHIVAATNDKYATDHFKFNIGFTESWGCLPDCSFYDDVWTYNPPSSSRDLIDVDGHSFKLRPVACVPPEQIVRHQGDHIPRMAGCSNS
ncbi:hypothetical protein V8E54_003960 [Elaphomyces granulatus]